MVDQDDDPDLREEVSRRADPPSRVVVVRPVPGVTRTKELAADVLIGLGKRFDALTREKQGGRAWFMAELWLRAEKTRELVVVDADRLPPVLWSALAGLSRTTSANVWLIASRAVPSAGQSQAAGEPETIQAESLLASLPSVVGPSESAQVEGPLPTDDFLTFRASCREFLSPARLEAVDRIFRVTYREALVIAFGIRRTGNFPRVEGVLDYLRSATASSAGPSETLVRLRAVQAAFFRAGLLVNLVPRLPGVEAIPTVGLTATYASRLRPGPVRNGRPRSRPPVCRPDGCVSRSEESEPEPARVRGRARRGAATGPARSWGGIGRSVVRRYTGWAASSRHRPPGDQEGDRPRRCG